MKTPNSMDVLFIVPPHFRLSNETFPSYPLGLGYLVSYLKNRGIYAQIFNMDSCNGLKKEIKNSAGSRNVIIEIISQLLISSKYQWYNYAKKWETYYSIVNNINYPIWNEVEVAIKKTKPKIVGITSYVLTIPSVIVVAKRVKKVMPDIKVIVGGPAATTNPKDLLDNTDSIDYLVYGEGENTISELASFLLERKDKLPTLLDIKGIMFKDEGRIIKTDPAPLISDLDSIPLPDRSSMFRITANNNIEYVYEAKDILGSRGCPYTCKFCAAHIAWGSKKARLRNVDSIIEEIRYLKTVFNQQNFIFWDDLFTSNRERAVELCEKIIENGFDINWVCLVRIDNIDAELLEIMKKAGCLEIQVGIESGNNRILKYSGKRISVEQVQDKAPIIRKSGIIWTAFFIIGFPSETEGEIKNTVRFISKIKPSRVALSIFSPYPGSELYAELDEKGMLGSGVNKSDTWYTDNNYTATMSNKKFKRLALKALKYCDEYNNKQARLRFYGALFKKIKRNILRVNPYSYFIRRK